MPEIVPAVNPLAILVLFGILASIVGAWRSQLWPMLRPVKPGYHGFGLQLVSGRGSCTLGGVASTPRSSRHLPSG